MFSFDIIPLLLSLPVIFLALSVHEASHGFMANKLGDPTAKSLGRLTLNPLKHLDIFGFLCMLFFRFGWAKPVPVNTRYFKKPRRDMALTAAAGPVSNVILSIIFAALLRLDLYFLETHFAEDTSLAIMRMNGYVVDIGTGFNMMTVLTYILYLGVILNISLAVFNLLPIPPFDGSRIAYIFLPQRLYFKVMQYERYIMIVILLLLYFTPYLSGLISTATGGLCDLITSIFGISYGTSSYYHLSVAVSYISSLLG